MQSRVDRLKEWIVGARKLRYGTVGPECAMSASDLQFILGVQLAAFRPTLVEGEEIYESHASESLPLNATVI
jgi:hypothetical protein